MFDFNEDFEEDFAPEMDAEVQQHMEQLKDKLARANYMAIKINGINIEYLGENGGVQSLKEIIKETIEYFEDLEEYEKCADLLKVMNQL